MTEIFRGADLAETVLAASRARIAALGRAPLCVTLHCQGDPAATAYLTRQKALAAAVGVTLRAEVWPEQEPLAHLAALAADPEIDAVMPLYPLPQGLLAEAVTDVIGPAKDADGLHPLNAGAVLLGRTGARLPATAIASLLCAQEILGDLTGAEIALIGASPLIGRPLSLLLSRAGATVTLCHDKSRDLARHCRGADLVISAAGVPGLLGRKEIAAGGRVLDLAIRRREGILVGDADHADLVGHAALLSHVPDGVGPVTTACLIANVTAAACGQAPDYGTKASNIC